MKYEKNCVFCRIVAGEIPATKLYEDEFVVAFMDVSPINKGHMLVVPKEHHVSPASLPEELCGRLFRIASRFGVACKRALDAHGFNLHLSDGACAGQVVMHAHLHVVPRWVDDGFHWNWRQLTYASDEERVGFAERLQERLKE